MSPFLILIALVWAGVTANLATQRGRSPIAWFLLGFFFGLVAIVLVVVLPKNEPKAYEPLPSDPWAQPRQARQSNLQEPKPLFRD